MTPPNATRADVLREFESTIKRGKCRCLECVSERLADEIVRLRAQRDAMRDALVRVIAHTGRNPSASPLLLNGLLNSVERIARAALREGGDDGA